MLLIQYEEHILIIDAGLMFPEDYMLGIDIVIQDFSYLLKNKERIRAIVLTHGHEDHIGALPFLLKEIIGPGLWLPVYPGAGQGKIEENITSWDNPTCGRSHPKNS